MRMNDLIHSGQGKNKYRQSGCVTYMLERWVAARLSTHLYYMLMTNQTHQSDELIDVTDQFTRLKLV